MAFGIFYDSPIFDGNDAICGIRTRRFNDNAYETSALAHWIAGKESRSEGFSDDVAAFVVDLNTGTKLFDPKLYVQLPEDDCPF